MPSGEVGHRGSVLGVSERDDIHDHALVLGVRGDDVQGGRAVGVATVGEDEQRSGALGADEVQALADAVVDRRALPELDAG